MRIGRKDDSLAPTEAKFASCCSMSHRLVSCMFWILDRSAVRAGSCSMRMSRSFTGSLLFPNSSREPSAPKPGRPTYRQCLLAAFWHTRSLIQASLTYIVSGSVCLRGQACRCARQRPTRGCWRAIRPATQPTASEMRSARQDWAKGLCTSSRLQTGCSWHRRRPRRTSLYL